MKSRLLLPGVIALLLSAVNFGQTQDYPQIKAVPVVTGNTSFVTTFQSGSQTLVPAIDPILLLPIGKRWLFEAEAEPEGDFLHKQHAWDIDYDRRFDYVQMDFLANRYLTVVTGRYLTPFGIFNERLHPPWIKYLQTTPLIYRLSALRNNGFLLRGAARTGGGVDLNYAAYFSTLVDAKKSSDSKRNTGGRVGVFLPARRLEFGASIQRILQSQHFNAWGLDATWQSERVPLDIHAEYARCIQGSGYWVEGAYRLIQVPHWQAFTRKSQAVVRFEQFFAPQHLGAAALGAGLPRVDTQRLMTGWNYYINDGLRLSAAYGREFTLRGDHNIWSLGIAYLFLAPVRRERAHSASGSGRSSRGPQRAVATTTVSGNGTGSVTKTAARVELKPKRGVDADLAYRANCSRCHVEPRKFSEGETATIMLHMRVRANLTEEETQAIVRYLSQ